MKPRIVACWAALAISFGTTITAMAQVGPDVITSQIRSAVTFGSEDPSGTGDRIWAFAVGSLTCNIGDEGLDALRYSNRHGILHQSIYRLKDGRFEQVGSSWVKHTFGMDNLARCGITCEGFSDVSLIPGCADDRDAVLNGAPIYMGPTWQVNAFTGDFPWPTNVPTGSTIISNRLQVHESDLDPALNEGASYFAQVQHIHFADAAAGNAHNNASYRRVAFLNPFPGRYFLHVDDAAQTEVMQAAIRAWKDNDPFVTETDVQIPGEGLFIVGARVTYLVDGFWHYEYAVQNLNSDRSGGSFTIPLPVGVSVENIGFHDVDYHDGEPWDGTDWTATVEIGSISWSTTPFHVDPNANALRWSTLYNFRFDADVGPDDATVTLGLFKPGSPSEVAIQTTGPKVGLIDCNNNGIQDSCDLDCGGLGCTPPCGPRCSGGPRDGLSCSAHSACPDAWCTGLDCNDNRVPDECEVPPLCPTCPDCNVNGIPDACEPVTDTDGDGVTDCFDLCPSTTPVNACLPPLDLPCFCCWPSGISTDMLTWRQCVASDGVPVCDDPPRCPGTPCPESCRDGCLMGDFDRDGDLDLYDFGYLQMCYSGPIGNPNYLAPSAECLLRFDFDNDGDVDLVDLAAFLANYTGP